MKEMNTLNSFETDVLMVFFLHSINTKMHINNRVKPTNSGIFLFPNGRLVCKKYFDGREERYEKVFDKLIKIGFIEDFKFAQRISEEGYEYLSK